MSYLEPRRMQVERWLVESNEEANFTYDLDSTNLKYLAAFAAAVSGQSLHRALGYVDEIRNDAALASHVVLTTRASDFRGTSDCRAQYGRRIGWYVLVRLARPRVVVETGVDKGLGSCVLTAALMRNTAEGDPGRYYGTDINPQAGWLLGNPYAEFGRVLYGDSLESLARIEAPIDLFINDSDHSPDYERREYDLIASKLSKHAIVLGDNAHATEELFHFARRTDRKFLFFKEQPHDHWYPGAGIGAAFAR